MALHPWHWILDKLARQPDVSIETLRECSVYVPDAARVPSLAKTLALRQLHEMLVSGEVLDQDRGEELVLALASPEDDTAKLFEMIGDAHSRTELFRFVERKKKSLETPLLDKIANDYVARIYPPGSTKPQLINKRRHQLPKAMPPVDEEHEQNYASPSSPRHLSVGSEDPTVVIDGSPDRAVESPSKRRSTEEVSCENLKDSKRRTPSPPAEAAPEAEATPEPPIEPVPTNSGDDPASKFQSRIDASPLAYKSPPREATPSPPRDETPIEVPNIVQNGSSRRSKRQMLLEDDEIDVPDIKPKLKAVKVMPVIVNLDSDDDEQDQHVNPSEDHRDGDETSKPIGGGGREDQDVRAGDSSGRCFKCDLPGKLVSCGDCPILLHPNCFVKDEGEGWSCPDCKLKKALEKLQSAQLELDRAKEEVETMSSARQEQARVKIEEHSIEKDEAPNRNKRRRSRRNRSSSGDDEDEDHSDSPRYRTRRKSSVKAPFNMRAPLIRRKKIVWSLEEEDALTDGVRKYGHRWAMIHQLGMAKFHPTRTGQDLKDKWRNMKKEE